LKNEAPYVEGNKSFLVNPGEEIMVQYINHFVSDSAEYLTFDIWLNNSSSHAVGSIHVLQVHSGYSVYVGTGATLIVNITAWLIQRSKSSSLSLPSSTSSIFPGILFSFSALVIIIFRRKK
jgi:hypothetical protein